MCVTARIIKASWLIVRVLCEFLAAEKLKCLVVCYFLLVLSLFDGPLLSNTFLLVPFLHHQQQDKSYTIIKTADLIQESSHVT